MPMDTFEEPPMDGGFDGGMMGDGGMGMGEGDPNMPVMDDGSMPMDGQNPFDSNFDPGVEADEEQDPKRFIQQLTGKLSQSLHQYNEGLPQPDADLGKYVAGMIIKQAIEGLSQEDKAEILDKVNNDEPMEEPQGGEMQQQEMPMDNGEMGGMPPMDNGGGQQMESVERPGLERKDPEELEPKRKRTRKGYKASPFTPNF